MEEIVEDSPMSMNKRIMISCILFAVLTSCQSSGEEHKRLLSDSINHTIVNRHLLPVKDTIQPVKNINLKQTIEFPPDTTINNKFFLADPISFESAYSKMKQVELIEKMRSSPVVIFDNTRGGEYLLAYQYEGSTTNSFSCFEVGYMKDLDLEPVIASKINHLNENSFKTESGLKLGISANDVLKIKGEPFNKEDLGNKTTLNYKIKDYDRSAFLKRYNMPGYFIELVLKEDKVVNILFGFDYP